jgi:hypothetical protein
MFLSTDRSVLSQVEKTTQFLQKYFGIKISTIISLCAVVAVSCLFIGWYFTGIPAPFLLVMSVIVSFSLLWFIFIDSKRHQIEAEERAAKGVSNPFKIMTIGIILRLIFFFFVVLQIIAFIFSDISTPQLIDLTYSISFWMYACTFSVDVLPPSDSKVGAWLKNLFRKRSLST